MGPWSYGTIGPWAQTRWGVGAAPQGAAQIVDPSLALGSLEGRGTGRKSWGKRVPGDGGTAWTGQDKTRAVQDKTRQNEKMEEGILTRS